MFARSLTTAATHGLRYMSTNKPCKSSLVSDFSFFTIVVGGEVALTFLTTYGVCKAIDIIGNTSLDFCSFSHNDGDT